MRVVFSEIADKTFNENLDFLKIFWTEKEMNVFVDDAETIIKSLKEGNFNIYKIEDKNIRSVLIGKRHVKMYFKKKTKN